MTRVRIGRALVLCLLLVTLQALPAAANHPAGNDLLLPTTPVLIHPEDGGRVPESQPELIGLDDHYFSLASFGTPSYDAVVEVTDAGGALVRTISGGPFLSGVSNAGDWHSLHAIPALSAGAYRWRAKACVPDSPTHCSPFSAYQSFTVADNGAPTVEILAPEADGLFEAGERQDFMIRATDPDGDAYRGRIRFRNAITGAPVRQPIDTTPAPSGQPSFGTLGPIGLDPGSYEMLADANDIRVEDAYQQDPGGASVTQLIGVASTLVSPCTASTPLVDGWFGDRYLYVSGVTVDGVGYVCLRTSQGAADVAGWLRAESGDVGAGAPTVGTTAACPDGGEDNLPFPLLSPGVGGTEENPSSQLWAALRRSGDAVTVCLKVKAAGGNLLDTAVTVQAPEATELTDLMYVPEALSEDWTPPAPAAPPAGLPSSECYEAASGKTMVVNARVDGQQAWLYRQADATMSRVCARVEGSSSDGGVVVRQQSPGSQPLYTLTTGRYLDDPANPCRKDDYVFHNGAPVVTRLHTTYTTDDPVGVCFYAAHGGNMVSAWLLADRTPDGGSVTHGIDP